MPSSTLTKSSITEIEVPGPEVPLGPIEKGTYKYTSELTRRLKRIEKHKALERRLREERRKKQLAVRKKPQIVPNVKDGIKNEEYVAPDPTTLERLIMKTSSDKKRDDNELTESDRELQRLFRRVDLESAGLMLDPGDEGKVLVYVDFDRAVCRNRNDTREVLHCAWKALIRRRFSYEFANPKGQPAPSMMRVGFSVETETTHPETVLDLAIGMAEYLFRTLKPGDLETPIGYGKVMLTLVHQGVPANGALPSSVGVGTLLYEH